MCTKRKRCYLHFSAPYNFIFWAIRIYFMFTLSYEKILQVYCLDSVSSGSSSSSSSSSSFSSSSPPLPFSQSAENMHQWSLCESQAAATVLNMETWFLIRLSEALLVFFDKSARYILWYFSFPFGACTVYALPECNLGGYEACMYACTHTWLSVASKSSIQ